MNKRYITDVGDDYFAYTIFCDDGTQYTAWVMLDDIVWC